MNSLVVLCTRNKKKQYNVLRSFEGFWIGTDPRLRRGYRKAGERQGGKGALARVVYGEARFDPLPASLPPEEPTHPNRSVSTNFRRLVISYLSSSSQ